MTTELLEIQPPELKFTFELKKQSSCLIHLSNYSDQYVAFKVKTTSPKKYCVRPNTGVIKPKETCDFTVTMQAQRMVPPDLQCKDKFLVQSTVVPFGTSEEEITSDMFAKDTGKYIEEKKLKVILISSPPSPVLLPINGELKQDSCRENIPPYNNVTEPEGCEIHEICEDAEDLLRVAENVVTRADDDMEARLSVVVEEVKPTKVATVSNMTKDLEFKSNSQKDFEELKSSSQRDFEELKSNLQTLDAKLQEAEATVTKLTKEKIVTNQEKEMLKHELEMLSNKNSVKRVQVGFPLLYVFMVAVISLALGYTIHS